MHQVVSLTQDKVAIPPGPPCPRFRPAFSPDDGRKERQAELGRDAGSEEVQKQRNEEQNKETGEHSVINSATDSS